MDPLSVSASVVGLLGARAQITSFLFTIVSNVRDAPKLAESLVTEMADIAAALGSLQSYVCNRTQVSAERGALILLEHVSTTLTGCVTTYSDLQRIIDDLNVGQDMSTFDKLKWSRQESKINIILQRLQNHKSSLTLMLTILQCQSMQEAESSTRRLCILVEEILKSNQDLADRIRGLERESSNIAEATGRRDGLYSIRSTMRESNAFSFIETDKAALKFTFEQDLQASRVYNRAINQYSMTSLTSTALYTTALSVFSNLSLSQVSNISFYALPIYPADLSNSTHYIFGEEGAVKDNFAYHATSMAATATGKQDEANTSNAGPSSSQQIPHNLRPVGLLGRFSRRKKITVPENPVHITRTAYDASNGIFTGLPGDWKEQLKSEIPQPAPPPPTSPPELSIVEYPEFEPAKVLTPTKSNFTDLT